MPLNIGETVREFKSRLEKPTGGFVRPDLSLIKRDIREQSFEYDEPDNDPIAAIADSDSPEQDAQKMMDTMAYSIAFGTQPDVGLTHGDTIKQGINASIPASARLKFVNEVMGEISRGQAHMDIYTPQAQKAPEDVIHTAEKYFKAGILTEDEFRRVQENPPSEPLWSRAAPESYYNDDAVTQAENLIRAATGGALQTVSSAVHGMEWLGGKSAVGRASKHIADWMDDVATDIAPDRPAFLNDVSAGFGSMFVFGGAGFAGAGVGAALKLPRWISTALGLTAFTVAESMTEAGAGFDEVLDDTGDRQKAEKAARLIFFTNLPVNALTSRLGLFAKRNRVIRSILTEAPQEGFQTGISQYATKGEVDPFDVAYSALIGGIVGGGTAILFEKANTLIDALPTKSNKMKALYNYTVQAELAKGKTMEEAHTVATQEIAKTEEGVGYIEAHAEASEAMIKAEASVGRDVEVAPEVAEEVAPVAEITEERVTEILESEATDEEIADTLIAELEGAPVTEEVGAEGIKEQVPEEGFGITRGELINAADRFFKANREFFEEDEFKSGEDLLLNQDVDSLELELENDFELYNRFFRRLPEEVRVGDVIKAFREGKLPFDRTRKTKTEDIEIPSELETPKRTTFAEPKNIEIISSKKASNLFAKAKEKRTKKTAKQSDKARLDFFIQANINPNLAEDLGVKQSEINKALRSWGAFPSDAIATQRRLNAGKPLAVSWAGITNASWITKQPISINAIGKFVKKIISTDKSWSTPSREALRRYIANAVLAIDTRISYSDLTLKVDSTLPYLTNGQYNSVDNLIKIKANSQNTVSHELGHYLDTKWGYEATGSSLNDATTIMDTFRPDAITAKTSKLRTQWMQRFHEFTLDISRSSNIGSEYLQRRNEVFARFIDRFVRWTNEEAGVKTFGQDLYNRDNFTVLDFRRFVGLLQEKVFVDLQDGNPFGLQKPRDKRDTATPGVENKTVYDIQDSIRENIDNDAIVKEELFNLGNIAFAENKTTFEQFSASFKETLGELWSKVEKFIQETFDAVVAFNKGLGKVGAIEPGAPLFAGAPELKLDADSKPVFNLDERFSKLADEVIEEGRRQVIPIKPLEGFTLNEIKATIKNMRNDKPITNDRQKGVLLGLMEEIGDQFFAEVESTRGEFIDATEFLEQDELKNMIDKGVAEFVQGVKFQKIVPPTQAELLTKEVKEQGERIEQLKEQVRERVQETFKQQDVIEKGRAEAVQLSEELKAQVTEQVKIARLAKKEGRLEAEQKAKVRIREILGRERRAKTAIKIERATRQGSANLLTELPVSLRGKFNKALANARSAKDFGDLNARILDDIASFKEAQELKKKLGTKRSKIAFIRKIAEFNQTVINEIKREVGLDKPLAKATDEQLNAIADKLKARLRFKESKGFRPKIEGRGSKRTDIPESLYEVNRNILPDRKARFVKKTKQLGEGIVAFSEDILGVISTRLANVNPKLKHALKKYELAQMQQVQKDVETAEPFAKKAKKMSNEDWSDLDLALKNGDTKKIDLLIEKYNMVEEFKVVKDMYDKIYKRAEEVGYDIGYRENYFPRIVEDSKGFLEFMSEREDWSIINEAIKRKEMALGRDLKDEEKTNLINTMIRGFSGGSITLSATGNMKDRIIDFVTPEMNKFYEDSLSAMFDYINSTNNAIEARRFFGKTLATDEKTDPYNNIQDSLGAYIFKIMAEGQITPAQEKEVRDIMLARFEQRGINGKVGQVIGPYKNLSYLTVMGTVFNTLTQIEDLGIAIYAGKRHSLPAFAQALIGKSQITKEDLGIREISVELENQKTLARMVSQVFKVIGLTKIDTIGKETLINAVVSKAQTEARREDPKLIKTLDEIFGDESQEVLQDLKDGFISANVKELAFSRLLDFQPAALSEVPLRYLKAGNGRIFYQLKTWSIKRIDTYRNEIWNQAKTDKKQAMQNMMRMVVIFAVMGATADTLKDLLLGRPITLNDLVVDNIIKLSGFSRYTVYKAKRVGIGKATAEQILPPTKLADDMGRDLWNLLTNFEESADINKLRTVSDIPLIGKLYYWWFGRGVEVKEKQRKRIAREN